MNSLVLIFIFCSLVFIHSQTYKCSVDEDCSLNGICSEGTCTCDSGWKGDDCGMMDLAPANRFNGYNQTINGTSSWGGRIVADPNNPSLFHLFAAEFTSGCGLDYWSPMSRIIRAESTMGPEGPYKFAAEVAPTFAHNPTVVYSQKDKLWLMYHIGCDHPTPHDHCESPKITCDPGNYLNGESGITVRVAKSLTGEWKSLGIVFGANTKGTWDCDTTNPSPFVFDDGSILLAYRGCPFNCDGNELINLAYANSFAGPYKRLQNVPIFNNPNEDPFIYRDQRGNWHLLMHSLESNGGFGGPNIGRHAFSRDGVRWQFNNRTLAYNTTVHFTDGSVLEFGRRERPQLFFNEAGEPTHLVNGVQEKNSPMSYTLIQPIRLNKNRIRVSG
eukprot:TRINITY_DN4928_c0_g1_i1.p1 TRINITY_DN4928_c0_g1~~TRINITY_DN4928_c0_g1_i1.p1  ORF type:complete len:386 (+),score=47.68 TRINITY_DN4928_c0_g1_i1:161-1318(+)